MKWGLKSVLLACSWSSYLLSVELYASRDNAVEPRVPFVPALQYRSMGTLCSRWCFHTRQGRYHFAITDKFYTSMALCQHLLEHKIYTVSTINPYADELTGILVPLARERIPTESSR